MVEGLRSSLELESSLGGSLIESGLSNNACGVEESAVSSEQLLSVRNHMG